MCNILWTEKLTTCICTFVNCFHHSLIQFLEFFCIYTYIWNVHHTSNIIFSTVLHVTKIYILSYLTVMYEFVNELFSPLSDFCVLKIVNLLLLFYFFTLLGFMAKFRIFFLYPIRKDALLNFHLILFSFILPLYS